MFNKMNKLRNTSIKQWERIIKYYSTAPVPELPRCDHIPPKYAGPSYESIIATRKSRLNPALITFYKKPLLIHNGHMQWLFDYNGKRYLDFFGGIVTVSVGHCHPKVTSAAKEQMNQLCHTTNIYLHPQVHEYAEMLTDKLPGNLKVVYFVNSGSEANELAIFMARAYTKNQEIISLRNAYHGMSCQTMGLTALGTFKHSHSLPLAVQHAMNPDVYKGLWGGKNCRDSPIQTNRTCSCTGDYCEASDKYFNQLEEIFKYSIENNSVAAFFAESIQGIGGVVQYPKGYMKKVADFIHKQGGLYIADEVQTGFGRLGDYFWGFESHGVIPDIVTMAKGIGNGFPLGAVVTTMEIASKFSSPLHFNTFGGNPLACAIGKAVLEVIEEDRCQATSRIVGTHLLLELAKLRDKYECVGDVRGKGLMIGVELVDNANTKSAMKPEHFLDIMEDCKDMGLLVGKGGLSGNVLRIKPPMCITENDANYAVAVIKQALDQHYSRLNK